MTDRVPHLEEILDPLTGVRVGSRHLYRVDHHSEPEREEECRRQGGRCAHVAPASAERSGATAAGAGEPRAALSAAARAILYKTLEPYIPPSNRDDAWHALTVAWSRIDEDIFAAVLADRKAAPPAAGSREATPHEH